MSAKHAEIETRAITAEAFSRMPDLGPCELVAGKIVPMTPPGFEHGEYQGNLYVAMHQHVRANDLGRLAVGDVGLITRRRPDTVRGADIAFYSKARADLRRKGVYLEIPPDLVVEVLSPGNRKAEVREKLDEYFGMGVRSVWVVDPKRRRVDVYHSVKGVCHLLEDELLSDEDVLPGFSILVSSIFQ
jgi:Uma2 family endonuclease